MEDAWDAVHEATPAGWYVGRPSYHDERREWVMYAYDPSERAEDRATEPGVDLRRGDGGRRRAGDGALPAGDRRRPSAEVKDGDLSATEAAQPVPLTSITLRVDTTC